MDILTILGLVLGFGAILGGQVLEGGSMHSIMQFTAAIIVLGGTFGAVLVNYPMSTILLSLKNAKLALFNSGGDLNKTIKLISELAAVARKDGLLALEERPGDLERIKALMRAAHSIKGAARVVQHAPAVELAHASAARSSEAASPPWSGNTAAPRSRRQRSRVDPPATVAETG